MNTAEIMQAMIDEEAAEMRSGQLHADMDDFIRQFRNLMEVCLDAAWIMRREGDDMRSIANLRGRLRVAHDGRSRVVVYIPIEWSSRRPPIERAWKLDLFFFATVGDPIPYMAHVLRTLSGAWA